MTPPPAALCFLPRAASPLKAIRLSDRWIPEAHVEEAPWTQTLHHANTVWSLSHDALLSTGIKTTHLPHLNNVFHSEIHKKMTAIHNQIHDPYLTSFCLSVCTVPGPSVWGRSGAAPRRRRPQHSVIGPLTPPDPGCTCWPSPVATSLSPDWPRPAPSPPPAAGSPPKPWTQKPV